MIMYTKTQRCQTFSHTLHTSKNKTNEYTEIQVSMNTDQHLTKITNTHYQQTEVFELLPMPSTEGEKRKRNNKFGQGINNSNMRKSKRLPPLKSSFHFHQSPLAKLCNTMRNNCCIITLLLGIINVPLCRALVPMESYSKIRKLGTYLSKSTTRPTNMQMEMKPKDPSTLTYKSASLTQRLTVLGPKIPPPDKDKENLTGSVTALVSTIIIIFSLTNNDVNSSESITLMTQNAIEAVVDTTTPISAQDVISTAVAEGLAGAIGSLSMFAFPSVLRSSSKRNAWSEALSQGDYFFTRSAGYLLLSAIGLPRVAASVISALCATFPYQIIKANARRRSRSQNRNKDGDDDTPLFDAPEVFRDTTKWIEYDVLSRDFEGFLAPLPSTLESASYGFMAALSSQLYSDVLCLYTSFGGATRNNVKDRSASEWASVYFVGCFSAAALFGIYEGVRLPVSRALRSVLTGGVDSCIGSDDFDMCVETFLASNPVSAGEDVGADFGAQVRGLVVAFWALVTRPGIIDYEVVEWEATVRSFIVAFISLWENHPCFLPQPI